ncbi:putative MFS family arabinose efflux permease [Paenibacillus amylolyticus]|uniref:MFS family arabinose efflux permease n=1 Tax=Paenibacillus amylolyticus TaxID=1451 RepID=A0AAP5H1U1_PAEAM|nr:MFS transporter [Paenibacillus amylolyticus]MDR6724764.1 putative MFS family arabinose efflux permease [Paenibacillus amylolyticus]
MPTKQASTTSAQPTLSPWIVLLLASACGLIVANLYYAQTVVGPISMTTGLSSAASGIIVTLTQLGYVIGLLFIVPLSDIIENRRLATFSLIILILALIIAAFAPQSGLFLMVSLFIGVGSVVAQILVPYATYLTSEEQRGRVVGNVMSGLLLGIMLARPVASFITSIWGWQAVFIFSAIMIALLTILLSRTLPARQPEPNLNYGQLIISLGTLLKKLPPLRRRALYQASLFGAFSLFWTTVPMRLANDFNMSQQGIAWFALAGVGGAIAAPIAGRLADRGLTRILTGAAMVIALLSFAITYLFQSNSTTALIVLLIAAITLDMAVSGNLVLGQRVIYSLGNEARGRINGIFMSIFFIGGAAGSSIGSWSYAYGGWALTSIIGIAMPLLAFLYYFTEKNTR